MKVYPIIYGRTKYVDYLPDFLVRPHDLEIKDAFSYVSAAIEELDPFMEIRYAVFSTNTYIIEGVACYLNDLAEKCDIKGDEHVRDATGRLIAGFVGVALKKEKGISSVPCINEQCCWKIYKEYITKQWEYPCDVQAVSSQEINLEENSRYGDIEELQVNLEENSGYGDTEELQVRECGKKKIVEDSGVKTIHYFVPKVYSGEIKGYISSINSVDLLTKDQFEFEYVSVTTDVLKLIKKSEEKSMTPSVQSSNTSNDTVFSKMHNSSNITSNSTCANSCSKEKGHSFWRPLWVVGAIIGGIIILILI